MQGILVPKLTLGPFLTLSVEHSTQFLKLTVSVILIDPPTEMSMSDSQRYPLKLCLIKFEIDIHVFVFENCLF